MDDLHVARGRVGSRLAPARGSTSVRGTTRSGFAIGTSPFPTFPLQPFPTVLNATPNGEASARPSLPLLHCLSMTYELRVNRFLHPILTATLVFLVTLTLSACGTPAAKDFGGSWKPVNRFEDKTTEIPLAVPYTYYAAPMDGTLKTMLARWTADNGMKLQYKLRSDFTLTKAASAIHTTELRDAASQLSSIYGPQGVAVLVDGPELVVEEVSDVTAPPAANPESTPPAPVTTTSSTASTGHVAAIAAAR